MPSSARPVQLCDEGWLPTGSMVWPTDAVEGQDHERQAEGERETGGGRGRWTGCLRSWDASSPLYHSLRLLPCFSFQNGQNGLTAGGADEQDPRRLARDRRRRLRRRPSLWDDPGTTRRRRDSVRPARGRTRCPALADYARRQEPLLGGT